MKIGSATDGERLAFPAVAAYGNAQILVAWQRGNLIKETGSAGLSQACKIDIVCSDRLLSNTEIAYDGSYQPSNKEYLLRTYSPATPSTIEEMLYPENTNDGDLFVSELDGSYLLKLTRRGETNGFSQVSPNARGMVYATENGVFVSEADGSNAILIYQSDTMKAVGGAWDSCAVHTTINSAENTILHCFLTGDDSGGKASEMIVTLRMDGAVLPISDAQSYYSTGFKRRGMVRSNFNALPQTTSYYNHLIRWETFDFGMNGVRKAAFVEYSQYSPYDSAFDEEFTYTKGGTLKVVERDTTDTYAKSSPKTLAQDAIMPVIIPNDNRVLYIRASDDSLQYIDDLAQSQPASITLTDASASYAYPQFSSSGEWAIVQAMVPSQGMQIQVISPETGETFLVGPETGVSGYASTYRTSASKFSVMLNYSSITERGDAIPYGIRLNEAQTEPVTIRVRSTDSRIHITPSEITLNPSETQANFQIVADDDLIKQGDLTASILTSISGGSKEYNGASTSRLLQVIDDDTLDHTSPTWPSDTKVGVTEKQGTTYTLGWTAASDGGRPIKEYVIRNGEEEIARTSALTYTFDASSPIYQLHIYAVDCGDNLSPALDLLIDQNDQVVPTMGNVTVKERGSDYAVLEISDLADQVQVGFIQILNGTTVVAQSLKTQGQTAQALTVSGLTANTTYAFDVKVWDTNLNAATKPISFKTKTGYTKVAFDETAVSVIENNTVEIALVRTGDLEESTDIPLVFESITATQYVDYSFDSGYVTFGAGESRQTITITTCAPYDDSIAEISESFKIKLGTVINGTPHEENTECVVTIIDNEATVNKVEMLLSSCTVAEDAGSVDVTVKHISNTASGGFSVDYKFSNGTATNGSDYTGVAGTLVFAPGETERIITIPILNDGLYESDSEAFTLYLRDSVNANGVTIGNQLACTVTITEVTSNIPVPVLEVVDDFTQNPSIKVTNILGGGRLKVYRYNTATSTYENVPTLYVGSYPPTSESWTIPINTSGEYIITRIDAQERESNFSQPVTVTVQVNQVVRPPELSALISITKGTDTGTIKLTISGLNPTKVYYYGVGYSSMKDSLVQNEVYGSRQMDFPTEITNGATTVIDNIPAEYGKYLNIGELDQGKASIIYGYTFTGCSSIYITQDMIK